jgi:hypothetical protein
MKGKVHQPNFSFSAYPLKALNLPEAEHKSYLHIYRNSDGSMSRAGNTKILPMTTEIKKKPVAKKKQPDHIEHRDSEWFASYE